MSGTGENQGVAQTGKPQRWSFGSAAFDERSMQLFVNSRPVELELKPLEVLRHLLQHAGEAVSKDDLIRAVWPGRVISDSALTSTIAKLREALEDEQDAIKTVHGFGYRLEGDVRTVKGSGRLESGRDDATQSRRLAAIMFTDLVGYSALAHRDEALAIELLELHRGWVREILPKHGGKEIETVGDAFLIEFAGALAAVECAVAIQQRFTEHNAKAPESRRMLLRIGIHLGDVEHKGDKLMGDGVNIASRIHGVAEPGGICVSEDVHHAVRNRAGFQFESLGRPELKNIATPLELFRISSFVSEATPSSSPTPGVTARAVRKMPRWIMPAALATAVTTLLGTWWATRERPVETPSVAVLPFENLSAEPDSAYFTDGLHDTVIGHLARVRDLKVISRTSVMSYRGKQANLRKIARELGVGHIVEGSVQRAGGRLRVAAQLIDTASDTHVWSSEYDRDLSDVFAVQADIAREVASAVHAQLTPQERARIERVPTRSQAAYDLYLRAVLVERRGDAHPKRFHEAIGWLEEAVSLDPQFALAYALLADMHDRLSWFGHDPSKARRQRVTESAATALRLAPDLAEAHIAKAVDWYHGSRNYAEALREMEIARTLAPGNARVHFWLAPIYRRQGRWQEALASFEHAATLDPLSEIFLREHAGTLQLMRRFAEAEQVFARIEQLAPASGLAAFYRAYNRFLWTGDLAPAETALRAIATTDDPVCEIALSRLSVALVKRRFYEAAASVLACPGSAGEVPKEYFAALAYWAAGDVAQARRYAQATHDQVSKALPGRPETSVLRIVLGFALAMLGDRDAALREVEESLKLMPLSRDALLGATLIGFAAQFHAMVGERERALVELEQALSLPGSNLYAHFERLNPLFDPLRGDPRFEKLVSEHLPKS